MNKEIKKIYGMHWLVFLMCTAVIFIGDMLGKIPPNMVGAFLVCIVFGEILFVLGDIIPVFNTYFGGGAILCILGSAILAYFGAFSESMMSLVYNFVLDFGFLDFCIIGVITGSILGMNGKTLVNVGTRYFVAIAGCIIFSFLGTGVLGMILGYGFAEAILYIAAPIIAGGVGAGAIPMADIYATSLGIDVDVILPLILPAAIVGNPIAIIIAGTVGAFEKKFPKLSGNGVLIEGMVEVPDEVQKNFNPTVRDLGVGLILSSALFILGGIMSTFIPLHTYANMIILTILIKLFKILPREVELAASYWYQFVGINLMKALIFGVGVALIDFGEIVALFSNPIYFILVIACVIFAGLGAGIFGMLVKFKFIESAVTAGLCMANAGGTGDVCTLGAANRMNLMPFAAISSRIGGAIILVLMSGIVRTLAGLML
ncbi:hypothetical protein AN639_03630 [Candidatus Epulonipiscium fishelsonii]|uniref:Uncharacterized protein n=1 Tax=Candidatus Epulonipiscium fishelsonii TaxID=77094 RepID=A0ACC8XDG0_9FIRM|nr:hypothetical protein AN396_00735 [Epulopiscium sp. SCG-B11WGA-EpuloA1]ONI41509.1 hypothetical protein AN639_03630 [Epulopiscium sp. SCG-B05WGA-EpuloA1]ONI46724.1 hypothetical protein AN644_02700 [Epulopiscium sp. SCG-C06WGA-EpuloA1]